MNDNVKSSNLTSILKQFYKPILMVMGIVFVACFARYFHGLDLFLRDQNLLKSGTQGQVIFLFIAISMCAIGFPRQVVCLTAGVVYGFWLGFLYATIATIVGAVITYSWALWLGKDWGAKYLSHAKLKKVSRFIRDNPFSAVLMCRLMPVGSSVVLNTTAGIMGVGWLPFLGATVLGSMPQTIVFVLLGGGVRIGHTGQIILSAVLFTLSAGLGIFLMKRSFSKKNDLLLP
ncbi:TVP38/TMEM64 family (TVP38) (PUBMED:20889782) [Commensalibacter communis]|uniref:TVP38/TMEM64 family protein n=1 Tax=Commensalibacter communis TaxID=2972786 RepID=UPI0022FF9C1F|nr:VTT domain-containing protein [Commensalibacter communis]CAI3938280.1 TVP38/TMEM64 family (TVP38) (PUBMED:20889782) [Commensalibacter communis]CAI3939535.1 TVP38/TMEM64 family (TVP38) (PUBMED:20889782) [Commensalibacter communis]